MHLDALEVLAVIFNIAYVLLAAKENIWCWPMGIIGSVLSIWLFVESKIYAESVLYTYYVIMGVYGWRSWTGKTNQRKSKLKIREFPLKTHLVIFLTGLLLTVLLFVVLQAFTDSEMPLLDSFTTVFSFIATWLVATKILENWTYWIVLNCMTTYLYYSRDLQIYTLLMMVYVLMSVYGYFAWRTEYRTQQI